MAEKNEQEPVTTVQEDPDSGPGAFRVLTTTPVVVGTDVWASREEDDPASPITGWVAEYTLGDWSLGLEYTDEKPTLEHINEEQSKIVRILRDAVLVMEELEDRT